MTGVTSFAILMTGFRTILFALSQSSSDISKRSPFGGPPTWIKTLSMRPNFSIVVVNIEFKSVAFSAFPRSATPPSSTASVSQLVDGDIKASLYPRECICRAVAAPMPRPPPIIIQTFLDIFYKSLSFLNSDIRPGRTPRPIDASITAPWSALAAGLARK